MKPWQASALLLVVAIVAGLGSFLIASQFMTPTFKKFDLMEGQSLSLDAHQRVILVKPVAGGSDVIVCAEPSPDVFVTRDLQQSNKVGLGAGAGEGSSSTALSQSLSNIGQRTTAIQLMRDGFYRACEAYQNGAISRLTYSNTISRMEGLLTTLMVLNVIGTTVPNPKVLDLIARRSTEEQNRIDQCFDFLSQMKLKAESRSTIRDYCSSLLKATVILKQR